MEEGVCKSTRIFNKGTHLYDVNSSIYFTILKQLLQATKYFINVCKLGVYKRRVSGLVSIGSNASPDQIDVEQVLEILN